MTYGHLAFGTHHKTGTVWMRQVLHTYRVRSHFDVVQCNRPKALPRRSAFLVNWDSRFPAQILEDPNIAMLHLIRDPRDVLLSGMRYHQKASIKREPFLGETKPGWNGRSYQDMICAQPDLRAKLLFEMRNKHAETLGVMRGWNYARQRAAELRYEDLMRDPDGTLFAGALERLWVPGLNIPLITEIYRSLHIAASAGKNAPAHHVANGQVAQWRSLMPRSV
ncbi:MAG: sulfotransferase domain-containing protein, partial [Shimia sp.]